MTSRDFGPNVSSAINATRRRLDSLSVRRMLTHSDAFLPRNVGSSSSARVRGGAAKAIEAITTISGIARAMPRTPGNTRVGSEATPEDIGKLSREQGNAQPFFPDEEQGIFSHSPPDRRTFPSVGGPRNRTGAESTLTALPTHSTMLY